MRLLSGTISKSFKSYDGLSLYFDETQGDAKKPTLIFLHGFGGDSTAWDRIRTFFQKKGFPTVGIDLRGHGSSQRSADISSYSFDSFAKDIALFVNETKRENYVIVGHCLGGIVSYVATAQKLIAPEKLVLIAVGYKASGYGALFSQRKLLQQTLTLLAKLPLTFRLPGKPDYTKNPYIGTGDIHIRRLLMDILHTSIKSYLSVMRYLLTFDRHELLSKISVPTLLLSGSDDTFFPPEVISTMEKDIPKVKRIIVEGENHIIVLNNPDIVERSIAEFIKYA